MSSLYKAVFNKKPGALAGYLRFARDAYAGAVSRQRVQETVFRDILSRRIPIEHGKGAKPGGPYHEGQANLIMRFRKINTIGQAAQQGHINPYAIAHKLGKNQKLELKRDKSESIAFAMSAFVKMSANRLPSNFEPVVQQCL